MLSRERFLSGNIIKILACVFMFIDHLGYIFFPKQIIFRIIGRIAFPLFAFMISEGARYTRNKVRYFITVAAEALIIELVYLMLFGRLAMSVFLTFSFSIPMIYALDGFKEKLFSDKGVRVKVPAGVIFLASVAITFTVSNFIKFDYGFCGALVPVAASLFSMPKNAPDILKRLDCIFCRVLLTAAALFVLTLEIKAKIQIYSLMAVPFLLFYSGKRGKANIKYFFYLFYPLHLAFLQILAWIIK